MCWWYPEANNTRTQKWSSIVQYSYTSIWDLKYTFSKWKAFWHTLFPTVPNLAKSCRQSPRTLLGGDCAIARTYLYARKGWFVEGWCAATDSCLACWRSWVQFLGPVGRRHAASALFSTPSFLLWEISFLHHSACPARWVTVIYLILVYACHMTWYGVAGSLNFAAHNGQYCQVNGKIAHGSD